MRLESDLDPESPPTGADDKGQQLTRRRNGTRIPSALTSIPAPWDGAWFSCNTDLICQLLDPLHEALSVSGGWLSRLKPLVGTYQRNGAH